MQDIGLSAARNNQEFQNDELSCNSNSNLGTGKFVYVGIFKVMFDAHFGMLPTWLLLYV